MKLDVEEMTTAILEQEEVVQESSQENELRESVEHYNSIIDAMKAARHNVWTSPPFPSTFQQHPSHQHIYTSAGESLPDVTWYADSYGTQTVVPGGWSETLKTSQKEGLLAQLKSMLK